jgi:Tfp pilus assembly protein PilE
MSTHTNQSGFSVVELAIILVVVGVLAFVGYNIYSRQNSNKTADSSTTSKTAGPEPAKANDVTSAPNIKSTSDLDKASAALDQTDPGGSNNSDANQLDTQLANF